MRKKHDQAYSLTPKPGSPSLKLPNCSAANGQLPWAKGELKGISAISLSLKGRADVWWSPFVPLLARDGGIIVNVVS